MGLARKIAKKAQPKLAARILATSGNRCGKTFASIIEMWRNPDGTLPHWVIPFYERLRGTGDGESK